MTLTLCALTVRKAAIFNLFVLIVTMLCLLEVTVFQIDSILSFLTRYRYNSMEVDIPFYVNRTENHCY